MISLLLLLFSIPLSGQKAVELCAPCHAGQAAEFKKHKHFSKNISCDACHGPSKEHAEAAGAIAPEKVAGPAEQPDTCGACHAAQANEYKESEHGRLVLARAKQKGPYCTTCHSNHAARPPAAIERQCKRCHPSLPQACQTAPESASARVSCANCHGKHTMLARK